MKRIIATLGLGALLLLSAGCNQLRSRYEMNQGIQAYKNKQFIQAVEHFTNAVNLDPKNVNGKLYRATAWMIQYVPGAQSKQNEDYASKARAGFNDVLKDDPGNERAMDSLAFLCLNEAGSLPNISEQEQAAKIKQLDEAKDWFVKVTNVDPKARDAYYSLGVIDWMKWYTPLMNTRSEIGMKPEDPGPLKDAKKRAELRDKYLAIVNDGIANLDKSLSIDKDYDDAMAYLNLLYRERADLADSQDQYKADMDKAEGYFQDAIKAKKRNAAKAPKEGQATE